MARKASLGSRAKGMRYGADPDEHSKPDPVSFGPAKAKEMIKNPPGGKPLSKKQKGLFGLVAGGGKPTRMRRKK